MPKLRLLVECRGENFYYKGEGPAIKFGRSLKCEFNIPRDDLSREHCLLETLDEKFYITDLNSKNGISINGNKLAPLNKTQVREDDTIVLSNIYYLKINPVSVKTKADIVLKSINPEIDTRTFQLELPEEKVAQVARPKKKLQKPVLKTEVSKTKKESAQMIMAFILILGFALYQALGE